MQTSKVVKQGGQFYKFTSLQVYVSNEIEIKM